jgi:hypothetical protein
MISSPIFLCLDFGWNSVSQFFEHVLGWTLGPTSWWAFTPFRPLGRSLSHVDKNLEASTHRALLSPTWQLCFTPRDQRSPLGIREFKKQPQTMRSFYWIDTSPRPDTWLSSWTTHKALLFVVFQYCEQYSTTLYHVSSTLFSGIVSVVLHTTKG